VCFYLPILVGCTSIQKFWKNFPNFFFGKIEKFQNQNKKQNKNKKMRAQFSSIQMIQQGRGMN
jgi:hypothetical protein